MTPFNTYPNESAQDQFGRKLAARLSETTQDLPGDISERLKAARMQALAKRKVVAKLQPSTGRHGNVGAASFTLDDPTHILWNHLASLVPRVWSL